MKRTDCARCGRATWVPNWLDPTEDMAVCEDCQHQLREQYERERGADGPARPS